MDRALRFGRRGCGFESRRARLKGFDSVSGSILPVFMPCVRMDVVPRVFLPFLEIAEVWFFLFNWIFDSNFLDSCHILVFKKPFRNDHFPFIRVFALHFAMACWK